ncbi:hypothetical protein RhiJN_13245 [Ceratobasidium sp. AG-Ba]|nr:hypothetical protein RhiJN_13245 [Ceratobasidium sp. AG-Ba]QRW13816.1 hypothetical protein RhiLY_12815 [Ceratobasidium sp. AG-Ba]
MIKDIPTKVATQLNFFDAVWEPSDFRWSLENEPFRPSNLTKPDTHDVDIHNFRSLLPEELKRLEMDFEHAGFHFQQGWGPGGESMASSWANQAWRDPKWIETVYYPYIVSLLNETLFPNAKIAIFDHTVRQRNGSYVPTAEQTHIDQTYWAALERIRMHHGQETLDSVLRGDARAFICNVWRPLIGPVLDRPLAVADRRTILDNRDLNLTAPALPGCRTGESQMIRYHPDQKWYYPSGMQLDECLMLKIFDSKTGVGSPHSAFYDPSTPSDAPPRWSMEVCTIAVMKTSAV